MNTIVDNKLVSRSYLDIISQFELVIAHMVFLHAHNSCIRIRFTIAITLSEYFFLFILFFRLLPKFFLMYNSFARCFLCTFLLLPRTSFNRSTVASKFSLLSSLFDGGSVVSSSSSFLAINEA